MKRFSAIEIVMLIFSITVGLTILLGIVGMAVMGKTTPENEAIRAALIDLLKYITAGTFGAITVLITNKKQPE